MDSGTQGFALADFWSLVEQAGPLRWPIFVVLGLGLVQIFLKLYELLRDRVVSRALIDVDFANADLDDVVRLVSGQDESMISRLQSALLNVYRAHQSAGTLHGEVSTFLASERDRFGVFRRRMDFLSDTAGALGLMGTVWGMFTVFFQGTSEQDVILRGMGIALITTLLGLVVSIVLNFSATELSTFFDARLDQVAKKSDELRFRLLELAPGPAHGPESSVEPQVTQRPPAQGQPVATATNGQGRHANAPWCFVDLNGARREAIAGEPIEGLHVVVRGSDGRPAAGVPVVVRVPGSDGSLNGDGRRADRTSDEEGRLELSCIAPERMGPFAVELLLPEQGDAPARLDIDVRPAGPHRFVAEGNYQATVAGSRLGSPFGVRVSDRYGNPVAEVPVRFVVREGDGALGMGSKSQSALSDATGLAAAPFTVSPQPGTNIVTAEIPLGEPMEFVALGTQP